MSSHSMLVIRSFVLTVGLGAAVCQEVVAQQVGAQDVALPVGIARPGKVTSSAPSSSVRARSCCRMASARSLYCSVNAFLIELAR